MSEFSHCEVVRGLFISGIFAVSEKNVKERNIKLILNLTYDIPVASFKDVRTERIEIDDAPSVRIIDYFDPYCDLIEEYLKKDLGVLVHCMAGVSRSASICLAFLMKHRGMTLLNSYNHLRSVRPQIRPNPGFFEQLIEYEMSLYGITTVRMVTGPEGSIPDVYRMDQDSAMGYFLPLGNGKKASPAPPTRVPEEVACNNDICCVLPKSQKRIIPSSVSPNKVLKPRGLRVPSPQLQAILHDNDTSSSETAISKPLHPPRPPLPSRDSGSDADDEMSMMSLPHLARNS